MGIAWGKQWQLIVECQMANIKMTQFVFMLVMTTQSDCIIKFHSFFKNYLYIIFWDVVECVNERV
jgi:hypothetical protein